MPTMRLSPNDKSHIENQFHKVLNRAPNNYPFPVVKKELKEWAFSLMPESMADAYKLLKSYDKSLVQSCGWCFDIDVHLPNEEGIYLIRIDASMNLPNFKPNVLPGDNYHTEVVEWCKNVSDLDSRVAQASRYVSHAIDSCTSAGQIVRVLPEDCVRFVPNTILSTLADAERKSRVPRHFEPDPEKEKNVLDLLAIGSISPEDRPGLDVAVITFREKP